MGHTNKNKTGVTFSFAIELGFLKYFHASNKSSRHTASFFASIAAFKQ